MSKEKTLHDLVCEKFEEIHKIIEGHKDKEDYAIIAVATNTSETGQLLVGTGANINLGVCNAMGANEGIYFAVESSSILFDAFQKNSPSEEVMERLSKMNPPLGANVEDIDLSKITPKTEA